MKQKLGICLFGVFCLGSVLGCTALLKSNQQNMDVKSETSVKVPEKEKQVEVEKLEYIPTQKELNYYAYIIYEDGERLTVYKEDSTTVFMETNILVGQLPDDVREQLKMGIGFRTEEDLYDFLESYSS